MAADTPPEIKAENEPPNFDGWTRAQMEGYAEMHNIDLGGVRNNEECRAILQGAM